MHYFRDVAIGEEFTCGGTLYRKKSSRTAWRIDPRYCTDPESPAWAYFGQWERINNG